MKKNILVFSAAAVLGLASVPAPAVDGMAIEAGNGDGANMARFAVQWDWKKRWFQGERWHLGAYWDLALGHWRRDVLPGENDGITEIGLTPVLRVQRNDLKGAYFEAAIGYHLMSRTSLGAKRFSTQFQFGDHVGFGYRFGAKEAFDVGYRFQHLSNADIKRPNNGINFNQVRVQYHY